MRKLAFSLLLPVVMLAPAAQAGTYGEALGKCMVERSTDADKQQLVEWIFSALAYNPQISQYARVSPEQHAQIDARMAALFGKLLTEYCRDEASKAIRYEGSEAFGDAFELLGKVAGQQMFESPEVNEGVKNFVGLVDFPKLQSSLGIPEASSGKSNRK